MEHAFKENLLVRKKEPKSDFPLFFSNLPPSISVSHSYLGLPLIPLLGRYSRDGYVIDDIRGLIMLSVRNDSIKNELLFTYGNLTQKLNIPLEVKTLITSIPDKIPHNKPVEKPENNKNNKNFKSKKPEIFDFHPFKFFPLPQIRFIWSITLQNKSLEAFYPKNNNKKPDNFKNILNHTWVFEEIDFSVRKKLINNIPCCVVIPKSIEKSCGVRMYLNDNKGINFGSLRSEYLSTHLIKDSLALSPNNMRIILDETQVLSHFWSLYLKTDTEHMIVYQWVFNEMTDIFQEFLKEAGTIEEFLMKCGGVLGEKHEAIQQIKELFS
jgi:hypothetical protein